MGCVNASEIEWFDRAGGEPVKLRRPDPGWCSAAAVWMDRIRLALGDCEAEIDHVGSTAVQELSAKPVLDLQVQVPDLHDEAAFRPPLESLDLVLRARSNEFCFFRPPAGRSREVHVHVCEIGSDWARDHLWFRDALRADDALMREYEALKLRLARSVGEDRSAYNRGKTEFIVRVVGSRP